MRVIHFYDQDGKSHIIDEKTNECWCEPVPRIVKDVKIFVHAPPDNTFEAMEYEKQLATIISKVRRGWEF